MATSRRPDLPVLYTTGTFYEVGYDVGRTFADRIKGYWTASAMVQQMLIPFVETSKGKAFYDSCLEVCKAAFPQYIREIEGMSDGSGFPFKNLFMFCLEKEVYSVLAPGSKKDTNNGCTDVLVNAPHCKLLAHNEDAYHVVDSFGYIVSARVVENGEEVESYTSYCYAGSIPGHAFSFNRHGMVFSSDGLYPNYVTEKAPPRVFLARAVIKAQDIQEATNILKSKGFGVAYGFTMNIVDIKDPSQMWAIEVGPQARETTMHVHTLLEESDASKPCHYIHANSIKHLQGIDEISNPSSIERMKRANQMDPPTTRQGVLAILGDSTHPEYPLFRTPRPTDPGATVLTAVADVLENRVDFYRENPGKPGQLPLIRMQILEGSN